MYFPGGAVYNASRRLARWIQNCAELYEQLDRGNLKFAKKQDLTDEEVKLIMQHLGDP